MAETQPAKTTAKKARKRPAKKKPAKRAGASRSRTATLSVLMPVYNERFFVREAVSRVLASPLPKGVRLELVIVDDGSSDGTREILAELAEGEDAIRLVFHEENRGKGAAIRTAIREMTGDFALIQDADLEYDPGEYGRLLQPLLDGLADVVYGSRFAASEVRRVLFFRHELGNRFLTFLSNVTTDLNLTDMETCYKAMKASILKSIPLRSDGFGLEPELTAKIAKRDCIVYEVPISYHGRSYEEGKKITWRDGLKALYVIVKYWLIDDCTDDRLASPLERTLGEARRYNRWVADLSLPYLGQHVLELGTGQAQVSKRLAGGRQLTLSDPDPEVCAFLEDLFARRETITVEPLDPTDPDAVRERAGEGVDTVLAFHLLERLEDPQAFLEAVRDLLPEGGRLILQVPRFPGLFSPLDEELGRRRRYGKLELRSLLARSGFEVDVVRDLNWVGVLGWLVNGKLLRRKRFGRLQLRLADLSVPLMRLLAFLPLPGLSLFAVARKR